MARAHAECRIPADVWVHRPREEHQATPMVFLGYEDGSKAYRLYDPEGGKVVVSRDVVFNEAAAWEWKEPAMGEERGVRVSAVDTCAKVSADAGALWLIRQTTAASWAPFSI